MGLICENAGIKQKSTAAIKRKVCPNLNGVEIIGGTSDYLNSKLFGKHL